MGHPNKLNSSNLVMTIDCSMHDGFIPHILLSSLSRVPESQCVCHSKSPVTDAAVLPHCDSRIFASIAAGLPTLAPLLTPQAPSEAKALYLRILTALLALDTPAVINPAQPSFAFVLESYKTLLSPGRLKDALVRVQALQLLGSFLVYLPDGEVQGLKGVLQQVVDGFGVDFPKDR